MWLCLFRTSIFKSFLARCRQDNHMFTWIPPCFFDVIYESVADAGNRADMGSQDGIRLSKNYSSSPNPFISFDIEDQRGTKTLGKPCSPNMIKSWSSLLHRGLPLKSGVYKLTQGGGTVDSLELRVESFYKSIYWDVILCRKAWYTRKFFVPFNRPRSCQWGTLQDLICDLVKFGQIGWKHESSTSKRKK